MINRSAENPHDRCSFPCQAGVAGLGTVGGVTLLGTGSTAAQAADPISDGASISFALQLEHLEAEPYSYAVNGTGLPSSLIDGSGTIGQTKGGTKVPFTTPAVAANAPVRTT